jgi:MFS family permease
MTDRPAGSTRVVTATAHAAFALIGWSMLLAPSLIRAIRDDFAQTDAGFGVLYLLISLAFGSGAVVSGALTGRLGRRVILPAATFALAAGIATQALAPAWPVFLVGAALAGGGAGALEAGVNGVVMDLSVAAATRSAGSISSTASARSRRRWCSACSSPQGWTGASRCSAPRPPH